MQFVDQLLLSVFPKICIARKFSVKPGIIFFCVIA
jgi:hypothetical protein